MDSGTLSWALLPLASQETRARGGRTGAGACTGHPLHPLCPHPPRRRLLPGKRCRTGVQSAGKTWWLSPARLPLLLLVPASVSCICASSRVPPGFLTRLRVPSAGSSARSARLEAEPRAASLPSPALQKALHRPAWSGRQKGPWMGRGRERMRVPKGAQWRGKVRRGAGAVRLLRCPSPRWPEAQCDVTVIPGRQAGPRALGPRATKRAKCSQPVRARALSPTLTLVLGGLCSW